MDPFFLSRDETCLVVVDVQERLIPAMEPETARRGLGRIATLIRGFRILGLPTLVTQQYTRGLGPTVPELREHLGGVEPIEKTTFSCLREESFRRAFAALSRRAVVLVGSEAHVCVLQTALDLLAARHLVHIAADAVFSRAAEDRRVALDLARQAGAVVTCSETVLFQLLERSGSDEFRAVSRLVK